MNCPSCQAPNPEHAKFCNNCGQALSPAGLSSPGALNLERFIPFELAGKLEQARGRDDRPGERRIITILFCDVKGSTAAAEQLDPEEWAEIMNGAFEHMIRPVYQYEGNVVRLMGDAILAFFGAPITHEDDPQRALLAALEIRSRILPFATDLHKRYGIAFDIRVGIHTGLVVVGEIGSDLRTEYTAMGDAVNLAARMEQTALPGTIQISHETYALTSPFFETEPLGELTVKGKSAPVRTYRVLAAHQTGGQLRGLDGLSSPLVGRENELQLLSGCLNELARRQGRFVAVIGEAGLGKSTLVKAARDMYTTRSQPTWLTGAALPYAHATGYFAWRQIIRHSLAIQESDPPSRVREKLAERWQHYALPSGDRAFMEAIMAVENADALKVVSGLQGDALLQRIVATTSAYWSAMAAENPLVLFFDDLHWADDASINLLLNLAPLIEKQPILMICTLRPDESAASREAVNRIGARLSGRLQIISLAPLAGDQTDVLAAHLLRLPELPARVRNLIAEKAEGNPFFVEELIRSLIETHALVREAGHWRVNTDVGGVTLPGTLAGVLSARIDRLPQPARQVLQDAAVIGRTFDRQVLYALEAPAMELDEQLRTLQEAGLVQPLEADPTAQFAFRHALLQDAAYNSILFRRRRACHRRIGEVLQQLFPERLEELAPLLAHHFHAAGDPRAFTYSLQAGELAAHLNANLEAATHFTQAIETAGAAQAGPGQIGQLYIQRGHVLELVGQHKQALANYVEMEAFAQAQGDLNLELNSLTARSIIYSIFTQLHNPALAEQMLVRALTLADRLGDQATRAKLHWNLMLHYLFSKIVDKAVEHGDQALALARVAGNKEQLAFVLNDLCRVCTCTGDFERGFAVVQEARMLWRELNNRSMLADSFGAEAEARFNAGDYDLALERAAESLQISKSIGNIWGQAYNEMLQGFIYLDRGEADLAILCMQASIRFGDDAGLLASSIAERADLAWTLGCYGRPDEGLALAEQALALAHEKMPEWGDLPRAMQVRLYLLKGEIETAARLAGRNRIKTITIPYARYSIMIGLANAELAQARGRFARAITILDELLAEIPATILADIPEVLWHKGQAVLELGRLDEAGRALLDARERAESLQARHSLWHIYMLLADLETRRGNTTAAQAHRAQAREIVNFIAEHLQANGLREAFIQIPAVRSALIL